MERCTWVRFAEKLTPCHTTHTATVSTPAGRWIKLQGNECSKGKHSRSTAHKQGKQRKFSGAMERYKWVRFAEKSSPRPATTHRKTVSVPVGRWNVTRVGSIRRKTHEALPRHTANSEHTSGAMERYMRGFDSAQNSRRPATTHRHSKHTIGAMVESSGKVQAASTQ